MGRRHGFSLIELLVVISIIALLIAILLPVLSAAREEGWRTVCRSQLHQIGVACEIYAGDYAEQYPPTDPYAFNTQVHFMKSETHDKLVNSYLNGRRDALWCPRVADTLGSHYADLAVVHPTTPGSEGWYIGYFLYYSTPSGPAGPGTSWGPGSRSAMRTASTTRVGSDWVWLPGYDAFSPHSPARQRGANQLFGDGAVRWRSNEDLVSMNHLKLW